MGITLRHDAAAVVPPSNQTTRKYGQSLVLQNQQQKYNGQQAGYDRLFQLGRDNMQNQAQIGRDNRLNEFQVGRDKTRFDQQQQVAEAERQRQFMDDARKLSSGMIMDDIQNGHYDPVTANKLRQNLVDEAEALANPTLDATQRAKVLQDFKAQRLLLTAKRMEKPPKPTPDEEIAGLPEINGTKYQKNKNGEWVPFQASKEQQQEQKKFQDEQQKLQQDAEQLRPKSFEEHYNHPDNKGQFQKDLSAKLQEMESERDPEKTPKAFTKEDALKKMREDYDFQQQALGKVGEPTLAPPLPAKPMDMTVAPPDQGVPPAPPASNQMAQDWATKGGFKPAPDATIQSDGKVFYVPTTTGPMATFSTEEEANRFLAGGQAPEASASPPAAQDQPADILKRIDGRKAAPAPDAPPEAPQDIWGDKQPSNQPAYPPSDWEELMAETPSATPTPAAPSPAPSQAPTPAAPKTSSAPPVAPDFGTLASTAANDQHRDFITGLEKAYQGASPEVQAAIGVLANPNASDQEIAEADKYLRDNGIDVESLTPPKKKNNLPWRSKRNI